MYRGGRLQATLDALGLQLPGGAPAASTVGLVRDGVRTTVRMTPTGLARAGVLSLRGRARVMAMFARLPKLHPQDAHRPHRRRVAR